MTETLFKNWHFVRWLRLILGLFFVYQAITGRDNIAGFFGAFLLFQAATNTGCGPAGCTPASTKNQDKTWKEPDFDIVKPK